MTATYQTLLSDSYLRAVFDKEFQAFQGSAAEKALIDRLNKWSKKAFQKETSSEAAFISVFFEDTWGYSPSGKTHAADGFTCYPRFPVAGAGAGGAIGQADAALGVFGSDDVPPTPQVMCEFKDVRSNLDGPQKRKGNNRSPVKQCADYLREAMKPFFGNEAIQPTWGIVTDMNEFRLYWRNTMPSQYQRFILTKKTTDEGISLLAEGEAPSFQRFLFIKLLHADSLLTKGGPSSLLKLLKFQRRREKEIETSFYLEYRAYRERLVDLLIKYNPKFSGTKGRLVRLAQKFIDRCIFVMFCEDMGEQLSFPPNALSDYLSELSKSSTFEPDEQDAWNKLKELFHAMDAGKRFRSRAINRFNGGLFATDPELDNLIIPNEVFCAKLQGESETLLKAHPLTLLYFAGTYNFGTAGKEGQAITLYTLGRIFEQSITELEVLEAEKEGRESLTKVTKRKRDGVYYTPEWVVERVVAETLGPRLDEIRAEVGWSFEIESDEIAIAKQTAKSPSERSEVFKRHVQGVRLFLERLDSFTVLDPACGSGAFLIHTLEYLLRERRRAQRELALVTGGKREELFEFKADDEIRQILSKNIFGVDINAASVEIARLALWLHTAKSDQPLSNLDTNIVEGNSLVGTEVYEFKKDLLSATEAKKEAINPFDYEKRFRSIFKSNRPGGPGFDCVVGNPPYVKLQNFKKVYPETADFLRNARGHGDVPRYQSCQTGNYDLYLPFIERGLELLNSRGRLGFIAPSLWRYNEYGEGLRKLLHAGGHLDRWIDFGSFQVFDEAIIYTALQFYTKSKNQRVRFALAPTGEISRIHDWDDPNWFVTYKELPKEDTWILVSRPERAVIDKLGKSCRRLDEISQQIFQGLITSADPIYHFERVGKNRYLYQPPKSEGARTKPPAEEIEIEDAIMHPLVSGREANRYQVPKTTTFILFPYSVSPGQTSLLSKDVMIRNYPKAWKHLKGLEKKLRARESNGFDDDTWWRFGRHQGIDKQEEPKLIVAQTVKRLSVCPDHKGKFYLNNVRVNGVLLKRPADFWFLLGILNSEIANWVFQRIAKPKEGGYFEANKQFIAPLPIPKASTAEAEKVTLLAEKLTKLHTARRDTLANLERRFDVCETQERSAEWLWPSVRSLDAWRAKAPSGLSTRQTTSWAKEQQVKQVETKIDELQDRLRPGARLEVKLVKGELRVQDDETIVLDGVFVDADEASQILIAWRNYLNLNPLPDNPSAAALATNLRCIRITDNAALARQIADLDCELTNIEKEIVSSEASLNKLANRLYGLSVSEVSLVYDQGSV
ncbi:Eco57I restriction-modification methylase domain-containing protein [Methylocapsa acidiphila]|uniref:Eco57I restriction-modification methylase domain-containing protein n=1 Tax=Methylocapsa acidiphila TaxID=133552 RepID=UPI0003FD89B4|nr:DNA methyltransferase [Methylocapsa acidiphila]